MQAVTLKESIIANRPYRVRQCHVGQAMTFSEGIIADSCDGEGDTLIGDFFRNHDAATIAAGRSIVDDDGLAILYSVVNAVNRKIISITGAISHDA